MTIKLYYWPGWCSLSDHIALEWVGADYELVKADEDFRNSTGYAKINPSRTVPAAVFDDGFVLSQNIAILNYIADTYPEAHLLGDGSPRGRAEVNRWLSYIAADVHKAFSPLLHPDRIVGDERAIETTLGQARDRLRGHFQIFDRALQGRNWLVANHRSIADPYLFVLLRWARSVNVDLSRLDNLARYFAELSKDPGVRRALQQEEG